MGFLRFFWCGPFKIFLSCYNIVSVLCFDFLTERHVGWLHQTSDWTWILCIRRGSLNYWTTRKVPYKNVVVDSLSHVWLFVNAWSATLQASLSFTISGSLLKLMSIELVIPSNYLALCHPFSSCLQSFQASGSFPMIRLFASGGQSIGASV